MQSGVVVNVGQHIVLRGGIRLSGGDGIQGHLMVGAELLSNIVLRKGCVYIGQLVVHRVHKAAECFANASLHILGGQLGNIAVDEDRGGFQRIDQVDFGVAQAGAHLLGLILADGLVALDLGSRVGAQILLDLHCLTDLVEELAVIGQHDQHLTALAGHQAQALLIGAITVIGGQHADADVIILVDLERLVVHLLVVTERIAAIELRVFVFGFGQNLGIDHVRRAVDDVGHFHVLAVDVAANFLLFLGQEYVDITVFLHERFVDQHVQRVLHLLGQGKAVLVHVGDEQRRQVGDGGFLELLDIFDEEQGFQHADGKAVVAAVRVDVLVVQRLHDDAAVGGIEEFIQCVIEQAERYKCAVRLVLQRFGGLLEQRQHRALALRQMLAGRAVLADGGQHAAQQLELVGDERVDIHEVAGVIVELHLRQIFKFQLVLQRRGFLLIQHAQGLVGGVGLGKDTLFDDLVHVGAGQRQAGVEAALNLGEVVALDLCDGIHILLAGDDDPRLALALLAQFLTDGLQVEHQAGIIADVLADLVHEEADVMIVTLFLDVLAHHAGEVFDADLVRLGGLFAPVAGGGFAHVVHIHQNIHDVILDEIELAAGILPAFAGGGGELLLELIVAAILGQLAFEVRHIGHRAVEALHLVKHLEENRNNSILGLLAGLLTLGVDVEQDNVSGGVGGQLHVCQHHSILNFVVINEIVHGALAADELLPVQQVGEDFQKVRFTTAEEAGDPDAGFGGLAHDALFVVVEKFAEVLGQFAGDNIFFQFLLGVAVLTFADNDNALDVTVNGLFEHIFD